MQLVRNGIVILVLIGVGYAVYTYVNKPEPTPPPGIDTEIPLAVEDGTLVQPGKLVGSESSNDVFEPIPALPDSPRGRSPSDTSLKDAPRFGETKTGAGGETASSASPSPKSLAPPDTLTSPHAPTAAGAKSAASAAPTFSDDWLEAQRLLAENRLVEAHSLLSAWYGRSDLSPGDEQRLVDLLGRLAGTIIYSNTLHLLEQPHITRDGDTLKSIAAQYDVPEQLLAKINGVDPRQPLPPGTKLKVVRGPFDAVLDLQRKEISLQLRGQYAGRFKIIRAGVSPEQFKGGMTRLAVKEKSNVRGEFLVGLERKLGIYAEDYSENALKMPAESSIELSARDAEDLYDILTYKSKIAVSP
jgi:hypothetical protein